MFAVRGGSDVCAFAVLQVVITCLVGCSHVFCVLWSRVCCVAGCDQQPAGAGHHGGPGAEADRHQRAALRQAPQNIQSDQVTGPLVLL